MRFTIHTIRPCRAGEEATFAALSDNAPPMRLSSIAVDAPDIDSAVAHAAAKARAGEKLLAWSPEPSRSNGGTRGHAELYREAVLARRSVDEYKPGSFLVCGDGLKSHAHASDVVDAEVNNNRTATQVMEERMAAQLLQAARDGRSAQHDGSAHTQAALGVQGPDNRTTEQLIADNRRAIAGTFGIPEAMLADPEQPPEPVLGDLTGWRVTCRAKDGRVLGSWLLDKHGKPVEADKTVHEAPAGLEGLTPHERMLAKDSAGVFAQHKARFRKALNQPLPLQQAKPSPFMRSPDLAPSSHQIDPAHGSAAIRLGTA